MRHPAVADLLAWYDAHARTLPWRAAPGVTPDPYRVWLSEIMLQQTKAAAVAPRFARFVARWPDAASLAAAPEAEVMAEWAGLGYYARARNLVAAARALAAGFPADAAGWRALPGVGDYTAAAVAAIAFGRPALPVDANIARVGQRLLARDLPRARVAAALPHLVDTERPGDVAQALMDVGATVCTARAARCPRCPLRPHCLAATTPDPTRWPARPARRARPSRHGTVFWLESDGHVLTVRRPPRGLLGGMTALPSSEWTDAPAGLAAAPAPASWRVLPTRVAHVFTHFTLTLDVAVARATERPVAGAWTAVADLALPTVFAKVARLATAPC